MSRRSLYAAAKRRRQTRACADDLHPGQERYVWARDHRGRLARLVALLSPRRFGKTEGFLRYAYPKAAGQRGYRAAVIYQRREDAKEIAWHKLETLFERYDWGATGAEPRVSELAIRWPHLNSSIKCFGADDPKRHRKFAGPDFDDVLIDECQDWHSSIVGLTRKIRPGLADRRGRLFLAGTPGPQESGDFFDIVVARKHPEWTIVEGEAGENPAVANQIEEELEQLRELNPNIDQEPWVQRDYYGRWVVDARATIVSLDPDLNFLRSWKREPDDRFSLSIDWGAARAAFTLWTWNPRRYPWLIGLRGWTLSDAITRAHVQAIRAAQAEFPGVRILADPGGVSATIVRDLEVEHGIYVERAQKENRAAQIELLKMDVSLGLIKLFNLDDPEHPEDHPLAKEWAGLVWITDPHTGEKSEGTPRDLHDTALYQRRYAAKFLWQAEAPPPPPPGSDAWAELEAREIKRRAEQRQRARLHGPERRRRRAG